MQNPSFKQQVYYLVNKIPPGKVATYGQIAKLLNNPKSSQAVGMCLSQNIDPSTVPCHRVVSSTGSLTGYAFGGIKKKQEILEKEGVKFAGEKVNLKESGWELKDNLQFSNSNFH